MDMTLAGWSLTGIAAAILIVAGIALLVVYALRRGLHHGELEGMDADPGAASAAPDTAKQPARRATRNMGAAGAVVLVLGLTLGVIAATGGWGVQQSAGPGTAPVDCAKAWNGCPQATPRP